MSLSATGISVRFGGVQALEDVGVTVMPGRIVGLVGPNGAGKTTLFNCLTGVVQPQQGTVSLDGQDISGLQLDMRIRSGIGRTFQTPRLDVDGTVLDAVMLGAYPHSDQTMLEAFFGLRRVREQEAAAQADACRLIDDFELVADPLTRAGDLSLGRLRLLEVARAMAGKPRFLLLDEPAAGVDERDRELLAAAIRRAAAAGVGVLLVEHNVAFVAGLSDELLALVAGRIVAQGEPAAVVDDENVVAAYLGGRRLNG